MNNNITNEVFLLWLLQTNMTLLPAGVATMITITAIVTYIMQPQFELLRILNMFLLFDILIMAIKQFNIKNNITYDETFDFVSHIAEFIKILLNCVGIGVLKGASLIIMYETILLLNFVVNMMNINFDFSYIVIPILIMYARWILLNLFQIPIVQRMFPSSFVDKILGTLDATLSKK